MVICSWYHIFAVYLVCFFVRLYSRLPSTELITHCSSHVQFQFAIFFIFFCSLPASSSYLLYDFHFVVVVLFRSYIWFCIAPEYEYVHVHVFALLPSPPLSLCSHFLILFKSDEILINKTQCKWKIIWFLRSFSSIVHLYRMHISLAANSQFLNEEIGKYSEWEWDRGKENGMKTTWRQLTHTHTHSNKHWIKTGNFG